MFEIQSRRDRVMCEKIEGIFGIAGMSEIEGMSEVVGLYHNLHLYHLLPMWWCKAKYCH